MAGIPYYKITACCNENEEEYFNIPNAVGPINGTYVYNGMPYINNGVSFEPGYCYTIQYIGTNIAPQPLAPDISTFTAISNQEDGCLSADCIACEIAPPLRKIIFTNCCDPNNVLEFKGDDYLDYGGLVRPNTFYPLAPGFSDKCYKVTTTEIGLVEYLTLSDPPPAGTFIIYSIYPGTECNDPLYSTECPDCIPPVCYTLINCEGLFFDTNTDLSAYIGQYITISNQAGTIAGTWFVILKSSPCVNPVDIIFNAIAIAPCPCLCYNVTGTVEQLQYVNCDNQVVKDPTATEFCSRVYPWVAGEPGKYIVIQGLPCVDGECPEVCYLLTNCQTGATLTTQTNLTQHYLNDHVVQIIGQEGCWEISITDDCDCAQEVIVTTFYSSCSTCVPVVAYRLVNCDTEQVQFYTTTDLSAYVGKTVEIDCGCYQVEQIDVVPPTDTPVVVDFVFEDCVACKTIYYQLTDCFDQTNILYTSTNLNLYLDKVIKIENCDNCWEVTETRTFTEVTDVVLIEDFDTCEDCYVDAPCLCSKITNLTLAVQTISYIDCENNEIDLTLQIKETSPKICAKRWILPELPDGQFLYLETFGNCQQGVCPHPVFVNNRTVRPGYNTPICTPEKYDQITCRFADIMYKIVLEKRYGITNCCPDEDDKWLIKKELIDLQALKDPNYDCKECECSCSAGNTCSTCNCKN
jgi:hypothetical protein